MNSPAFLLGKVLAIADAIVISRTDLVQRPFRSSAENAMQDVMSSRSADHAFARACDSLRYGTEEDRICMFRAIAAMKTALGDKGSFGPLNLAERSEVAMGFATVKAVGEHFGNSPIVND